MTENHFVASQKGPFIFNFIILRTLYLQYDILADFVSGMVFANTKKY